MSIIVPAANIRNIILLGHTGSGKTMLFESILFSAKAIKEKGSIDKGTTVSDYDEEEKSRRISLKSTLASIKYQDYKFNFIDAPGSAEFVGEVRAAIQVIDGAIIVMDWEDAVQIETVKHYKLCEDKEIPRIFFLNYIDKNAKINAIITKILNKPIDIENIDTGKIIKEIEEIYKKDKDKVINTLSEIISNIKNPNKNLNFEDIKNPLEKLLIKSKERVKIEFEDVLKNLYKSFVKPIVPIVFPIIENKKILGYIDILHKKAYIKDGDNYKETNIPDNKKDEVNKILEKLMEAVAEGEDSYIEKVLSGEQLSEAEIFDGFSKTVSKCKFIPVVCGSTIDNGGILPLLNTIGKAFPSYISKKTFSAISRNDNSKIDVNISESGNFCGFCFKTVIDQFNGRLSFIKVLTGEIKKDDEILIVEKNNKFKVTKILQAFGNKIEEIEKGIPGDIVVIQKIDDIATTYTLGSKDIPYVYAFDKLPQPVYSVAISAKDKNTEDKLISTLHKYSEEDPTLIVKYDPETKQNVVSGMGELHLEVYFSKIRKQLKLEFETSIPRINYKETITKQVEARYKHKKQSGGHGQYGEVAIRVSPNKRGEGFKFINSIVGGVIPKQYIPGVEKGLIEGLNNGVLGKFPIIDIVVELFDGSYHEVDSSEMSFKIAARQALKEAMTKGDSILLEPIMTLSVYAMDKYTGDIISDLNGKRGKILGMDPIPGGLTLIKAEVPHSELLRYATDLKSITQGTASFELEFSHYSPITGKLAEQVLEERKKFITAEEEE